MGNSDNLLKSRAARYRKPEKPRADSVIVAHLGKTPKGKIRLYSISIKRKNEKEEAVSGNLPENDPRYVFDSEYAMRKVAHDIVRSSGRFTRFYDSSVKIVYDSV